MTINAIESVLRGVLGGRHKRSLNALDFLTGRRGGSVVNASNLLSVAGVAWGIFETLQSRQIPGSGAPGGSGTLPGSPGGMGPAGPPPPPIPTVAPGLDTVVDDAARMLRLAISAAAADGAIGESERAAIVEHAKAAGVEALVAAEIAQPRLLASIVEGVTDAGERATLYVLAFTILRADEQITGAERIYLARLANLLNLEPSLVQALEKDTGERIDAMDGREHRQ